jgi:hypothetical protein
MDVVLMERKHGRAVDECMARVVEDVAPKHVQVLVNNAGGSELIGKVGVGRFTDRVVAVARCCGRTVARGLDAGAGAEDVRSEYAGALLDRESGSPVHEEGARGVAGDRVVCHGHDEQRRPDRLLREQGGRERLPRSS